MSVRSNSVAASENLLANAGRYAVLAALAIMLFAILAIMVEQTGAPQSLALALSSMLVLPVALLVGIQTRTMSLNEWTVAGRACSPTFAGLAQAASILAICGLVSLAGRVIQGGGDAMAWMIGPVLGLVAGTLLIAPYLRNSGALSVSELVAARYSSPTAGSLFAIAILISAFLICQSVLAVAIGQAGHFLSLPRGMITIAMAATILLCVLPGGIRGSLRANALVYVAAAVAIVGPVTWLSVTRNGWPIPHIGYGLTILADVGEIETQLKTIGGGLVEQQVDVPGAIASANRLASLILMAFLAVGIAAAQFILGPVPAIRGKGSTFKSTGYALMMTALVLGAVPALAAYAKLGLYDDLLGISFSDAETFPNWLFSFTPLVSATDPGIPMARICGRAATDISEALLACGGNGDQLARLADFRLSGDTITLGFGNIAGLPSVVGLLTGMASVLLPLALANALAQASGSVVARMTTVHDNAGPVLATSRLFVVRLFVTAFVCAAAWLGGFRTANPAVPLHWGIAISGGVVFPVVILTIWWRRFSRIAAIVALSCGGSVLAAFAFLPSVTAFALGELPVAVSAGCAAFAISIIAAVVVSLLVPSQANQPLMDAIRLPDTSPLLRAPSW